MYRPSIAALFVAWSVSLASGQSIGVNVLLNTPPAPAVLALLGGYGQLLDPPVTTSMSWLWAGGAYEGEMNAKFRATAAASGEWSVEATFKPHSLMRNWGFYSFDDWQPVKGNASGLATATPGIAVQMTACCLTSKPSYFGPVTLSVVCTFTVDAEGVVTVQSIGFS